MVKSTLLLTNKSKGIRLKLMRHNKSEYIMKHKGRWIVDTNHSLERLNERTNQLTWDDLSSYLIAMVDRLESLKVKPEYNTEMFVWFRQLRQGFIVSMRRDTKSGSPKLHYFIVTVMPEGVRVSKDRHKIITIK